MLWFQLANNYTVELQFTIIPKYVELTCWEHTIHSSSIVFFFVYFELYCIVLYTWDDCKLYNHLYIIYIIYMPKLISRSTLQDSELLPSSLQVQSFDEIMRSRKICSKKQDSQLTSFEFCSVYSRKWQALHVQTH